MGIDVHALNFLRYAKQFGAFGRVLTIGRQNLDFRPSHFRQFTGVHHEAVENAYCEPLLKAWFGATSVDSLDNSDFEQATIVHDLNQPAPEALLAERFDTVFDGGCLEHVFNAPTAFRTLSDLTRPGGQILHVLPANNFCGHGFYQFSPEFFFSLYSEANGYRDTRVFLADVTRVDRWFAVSRPTGARRASAHSATPLYALVRTVRAGEAINHHGVQQSDYVHRWADAKAAAPAAKLKKPRRSSPLGDALRRRVLTSPRLARLAAALRPRSWSRRLEGLSEKNPHLAAVAVGDIKD
jgi:hypothetical protein